MIAGVCVSEECSAEAHSDGDVVLHALVDALLGALAMGDIGELFPNTDPRWKNADSRLFVEEALRRVHLRDMKIANIDITILAERPKLKPFKEAMRQSLSRCLKIDESQINLKAGTNESCDAIGEGKALAAHVVVLLE